ncbi:MAG: hypothetical protein U5R31_01745 [Acidimicrobiia bacterium]|nr:hypothetical protein [Acidimicrobiia bacterium]
MRKISVLVLALFTLGLVASCSDDNGGGGDTAGFCEVSDEVQAMPDDGSAEDMTGIFDQLDDVDVPDEIADDVETLREGFESLTTVDTSDPDALANLDVDFAAVEEAAGNIEAYAEENC